MRWVTETGHKASHEDDLCHLPWLDQHLTGKQLETVDRDAIDATQEKRKDEGSSNATANRTARLRKGSVWSEMFSKKCAAHLAAQLKKERRHKGA